MRTLTVDLGDRSYPIFIGRGIRQQKALFDDAIHGKQVMIVTNETIAPLYLDSMVAMLSVDYHV
ncbi:MAG: 3-dehydroquinate synthase, partial [Marinomonas primoryensis]